jgi:uncharacterized protein (TIGR03067 family)
MRGLIPLVVAVGLGAAAAEPPADPIAEELKALQGTWSLVECEWMGKRQDRKAIEEEGGKKAATYVLRVEGEKVTWRHGDYVAELKPIKGRPETAGTYRLDPRAKPKAFDACLPSDRFPLGSDWRVEGIYRLQGDRLEMCVSPTPDTEGRPKDFKPLPERWTVLYVLERDKKPEK